MLGPKIYFESAPIKYLKCRSDSVSPIKDGSDKIVTLCIENSQATRCKLLIRLLLKDPEDSPHFYHLVTLPSKERVWAIEYNLADNQTHVKLDFFGIRKAIKKEAMVYLKEMFKKDSEAVYKKNSSTVVLQISIVDCVTNEPLNLLKFEFCDKMDKIVIKEYSPHTFLYADETMELTFVLDSPEKDTDSIYLDLDVDNKRTSLRVKELSKATSIKNVFVFNLKQIEIPIGRHKARFCRKPGEFSDWMEFKIIESGIEKGKRKTNSDYDFQPQCKMPRAMSTSISESTISDVNIEEYISSPSSSLSFVRNSSKQDLKSILETRVLSQIARVGHDYAFGNPITDTMRNITKKLPVVYILQDEVGDTPLHNAILKNQEQRARQILKIISKNFSDQLFLRNTSEHTALILSPACGVSVEFVELLLSVGFNVEDKDIDGNNALSIAIEYRNTVILDTLVENVIERHAFISDIAEVYNLLQKTIQANYFEGFEIVNRIGLLYSLSIDALNLDPASWKNFGEFQNRMKNNITPLPELHYGDIMNVLDANEPSPDTGTGLNMDEFERLLEMDS